jgi:hypothetical protein
MTAKDEQNPELEKAQIAQDINEPSQFSGLSRRRFAQSGLAISGVLMTLATKPVLGQSLVCRSPSGWLSGNASSHGTPPVCEGRSPGYWKNHTDSWPALVGTDTKFGEVFSCNLNSPYVTVTLLELLDDNQGKDQGKGKDQGTHLHFDKDNLGMHLVAAYLNAVQGWTPFLKIETIKAMFTEWQANGTFSPTAGVNWSGSQIVDYLSQTQA